VWNLAVLSLVCLVYALGDYIGYNLTRHDTRQLRRYRIGQVCMQMVLTGLTWFAASWATALAFNLIWWTFGEDILYYAFAAILNPGGRWESRGNFRKNILGNRCTWAFWTPAGMMRGMNRAACIPARVLIPQAIAGLFLAVILTLFL
jgi:hypothetical protein